MTSWNSSSAGEPEFRVEGEKGVSRFKIPEERPKGIGGRIQLLDEDSVPFKKAVGFV